jgi:hypothetical protein
VAEQRPDHSPAPASADAGMTGAAGRLSQDLATLLHEEFDRARDEITATARRTGLGTAALAAGGVFGILSLMAAHQTVLRRLERLMPPHRAAATLTCIYTSCAGGLAWYGYREFKDACNAAHEAVEQVGRESPDGGPPR